MRWLTNFITSGYDKGSKLFVGRINFPRIYNSRLKALLLTPGKLENHERRIVTALRIVTGALACSFSKLSQRFEVSTGLCSSRDGRSTSGKLKPLSSKVFCNFNNLSKIN